ncbi:DUF6907 domain-containing protein [Streptomyces acidiscabies]|uniref:DUF6907 domain-containing protein n=1 Tax=Streptomyces acidiscabies TaxID=42234 RepID=UPI000951FA7A|nr:hypothetical protein [Streptomyces acidiscabies]
MNEPRTVTLATVDHGDVTLPEPSWCLGHADHHPGTYRNDITHYGPETVLAFQGDELFRIMLTASPYSPRGTDTVGYIEEIGYARSLAPADLYDLAATLTTHADRIRRFADRLTAIRAGGDG